MKEDLPGTSLPMSMARRKVSCISYYSSGRLGFPIPTVPTHGMARQEVTTVKEDLPGTSLPMSMARRKVACISYYSSGRLGFPIPTVPTHGMAPMEATMPKDRKMGILGLTQTATKTQGRSGTMTAYASRLAEEACQT